MTICLICAVFCHKSLDSFLCCCSKPNGIQGEYYDNYIDHEFDSGIDELHRVEVIDNNEDDLDSYRQYQAPSGSSMYHDNESGYKMEKPRA